MGLAGSKTRSRGHLGFAVHEQFMNIFLLFFNGSFSVHELAPARPKLEGAQPCPPEPPPCPPEPPPCPS
ncbi:hypothetical protein DPMN_056916 [Dreissena polymorpha]|uniref:Uncharacterized protein n=1 Tax=Dreissena polymorpha TaxID=45954 RepID=A0A9D4HU26_DREPO|nr:hypothetical protein DPMN_056916 [Dreissena polymorpha]